MLDKNSGPFIVFFAVAICLVCSAAVSSLAVALKERQLANAKLDKQKNILRVAGLIADDENPDIEAADKLFNDNIEGFLIDRLTGEKVDSAGIDVVTYEQLKQSKTPDGGVAAGDGPAKRAAVKRLPNKMLVFKVNTPGKEAYILPIYGNGLWSTLLGFLAISTDATTIKGITYYSHAETPGLGGEVDNPKWKAKWPGRKIYGADGSVKIKVRKGGAIDKDYDVDALSGATITSDGVTWMLQLWLGPDGYKPFLDKVTGGS